MEKMSMKCDEQASPLVSIWCCTYNHKEYIRDAIEGFLAQKTTFPYEIVIHDDVSTDGTKEILMEYEKEYPDLIRVIYEKENIYNRKDRRAIVNGIITRELKGKYVAFCEGDDYWTNPNKLQMQVDYLEKHNDCTMVTHNYLRVDCESGEKYVYNQASSSRIVSAKDAILNTEWSFPTASYVVRKEICVLEGFFAECEVADYPLKLNALSKGHIYYIDDVMSAYRFKSGNSWTSKYIDGEKHQAMYFIKMIVFLQEYDKYTNGRFRREIEQRIRVLVFGVYFIADESRERFPRMIEEFIQEMDIRYHMCIDKLATLYQAGTSVDIQISELLSYCKCNKNIWLWGTGVVSNRYSVALEEAGVEIQGYIVTEHNELGEFRGKKVWEIKDFPYNKEEQGIVVAAGMYSSYEILNVLDEYNITNYYCTYVTKIWD